jgi:hypothetical protein
MSLAVLMTSPEGSCRMSMAFSGITTSWPAMAFMLAIEAGDGAAPDGDRGVVALKSVVDGDAVGHEPPGLLMRTVSSVTGPSTFGSSGERNCQRKKLKP